MAPAKNVNYVNHFSYTPRHGQTADISWSQYQYFIKYPLHVLHYTLIWCMGIISEQMLQNWCLLILINCTTIILRITLEHLFRHFPLINNQTFSLNSQTNKNKKGRRDSWPELQGLIFLVFLVSRIIYADSNCLADVVINKQNITAPCWQSGKLTDAP